MAGRLSNRRSLKPSKANIQEISSLLSILWIIFVILDPDTDELYQRGPDPDPADQNQCESMRDGSGSTTLSKTVYDGKGTWRKGRTNICAHSNHVSLS